MPPRARTTEEILARVMRLVRIDASGCWIWTAHLNEHGYATFSVRKGRTVKVHRWLFEQKKGPATGLDLDHLCRTPACVNPEHLEAVTHRENLRRGETFVARQLARTHCPRGHAYSEHGRTYRGKRQCRTCQRDRERERYRTDPAYAERRRDSTRRSAAKRKETCA